MFTCRCNDNAKKDFAGRNNAGGGGDAGGGGNTRPSGRVSEVCRLRKNTTDYDLFLLFQISLKT